MGNYNLLGLGKNLGLSDWLTHPSFLFLDYCIIVSKDCNDYFLFRKICLYYHIILYGLYYIILYYNDHDECLYHDTKLTVWKT